MKLVSFYQNGHSTLGIQQENGIIPVATTAAALSQAAPEAHLNAFNQRGSAHPLWATAFLVRWPCQVPGAAH